MGLAAAAGTALAAQVLPLRAARWLAPSADKVRALSERPPECLAPPADPARALSVEVGRAAFRDPLVLGGQAARAGVACDTCHANGRRNADFHFPGVSGAPGTADVTSFVFSSHRGDWTFDPRPIPDLGGPKSALKVDQSRSGAALEHFIRGLITEEFDGPQPAPAILAGLADYVRAMDPAVCAGKPPERITVADDLADAARAARAARALLARSDAPAAAVLLEAARAQLGRVDERYAVPGLEPDRGALAASALTLSAAVEAARAGRRGDAARALTDWLADLPALAHRLARDEPRSFYSRARLAAALGRS
ncbi:MAG TPA: hypothetical protein VGS12_09655 [Caulobacteraceae bacterium]|nr:hypothetical protein [Caulobacteraceae bacterium]